MVTIKEEIGKEKDKVKHKYNLFDRKNWKRSAEELQCPGRVKIEKKKKKKMKKQFLQEKKYWS